MKKQQLDHVLRAAGRITGERQFVIIGSQSLHASSFKDNVRGRPPVNVGRGERLASLAGGGALATYGLSRGGPAGLLLGVVGTALVHRGWTGHCYAYQTLGMNSAEHREQTAIPSGQGIKLEESVTIGRTPVELYQFWRKRSTCR